MITLTQPTTFGAWISERRAALRLKSFEAAKLAGMTKQAWSDLENDRTRRKNGLPTRPQYETLLAIASALELDDSDVMKAAREFCATPRDAPEDVLTRFPGAHSISNDEDVLASRNGREVIPASKMERARKMIEDGQKSINDGLRLLEQAKEELEEG